MGTIKNELDNARSEIGKTVIIYVITFAIISLISSILLTVLFSPQDYKNIYKERDYYEELIQSVSDTVRP